jgi:hypothetical protein
VAIIAKGALDARFNPQLPKGELVVRVTSKVLEGYEKTDNEWRRIFQSSLGRDNLWVRADEHAALAKGQLSKSLLKRIARFHLIDNTRGEPPMWKDNEIKKLKGALQGKNGNSQLCPPCICNPPTTNAPLKPNSSATSKPETAKSPDSTSSPKAISVAKVVTPATRPKALSRRSGPRPARFAKSKTGFRFSRIEFIERPSLRDTRGAARE